MYCKVNPYNFLNQVPIKVFLIIFFLLNVFYCQSQNQDGRLCYIVFFKDKGNETFPSPYSLDKPLAYLSSRSMDRREKHNIAVKEEDFPVNPFYIKQLNDIGVSLHYTLRWFNGVLVEAREDEMKQIGKMPFVANMAYVSPIKRRDTGDNQPSGKITSESPIDIAHFVKLGIDKMHLNDYTGAGVYISIIDSGFEGVNVFTLFESLYENGQITDYYNFVEGSSNVYQHDDHGTQALSILGGYRFGVYSGGAYKSSYQLYVTEDVLSEYRIEEYNWAAAVERADSVGADIISNTLSYSIFDEEQMNYTIADIGNKTAIITQAALMATARGLLLITSAGNMGNESWRYITFPADAQGSFAVGALDALGKKAPFSSVGLQNSEKIKPEGVAPGTKINVINGQGKVQYVSGTSVATSIVTSLAAGLLNAFPSLTNEKLYRLMITSSNNFFHPNNQIGYGTPHYMVAHKIMTTAVSVDKCDEIPTLFPNPVVGESFQIYFPPSCKNPILPAPVLVYTSKGELLQNIDCKFNKTNKGLLTCDVSDLSADVYFINLMKSEAQHVFRMVKE